MTKIDVKIGNEVQPNSRRMTEWDDEDLAKRYAELDIFDKIFFSVFVITMLLIFTCFGAVAWILVKFAINM